MGSSSIGVDLHIPFPIAIRASYGYWLSYFTVVTRGILALFWFGVQSVYGGQCITGMLTAIWPSYATITNRLPESAGITDRFSRSNLGPLHYHRPPHSNEHHQCCPTHGTHAPPSQKCLGTREKS